MATREENLKKINADENEMLSDEELEKVSGGLAILDENGSLYEIDDKRRQIVECGLIPNR